MNRMISTVIAYFSFSAALRSICPRVRVLGLTETTIAHIVFGLFQAMCRIAFDDAGVDCIGKDASQQADRSCSRSGAAAHDGLAAQLPGLHGYARFPSHDVFQDLVDVGLGEIFDPARADQRDDVPSMRPVSVPIVVGFFGRPPLPRISPALRSAT